MRTKRRLTPIVRATGRTITPSDRYAGASLTCTAQAANGAGSIMAVATPVTVAQSSDSR
jgi:hypothetical protein